MLDSLRIRNFRLFEELDLPRLGRVNLIVGKNNSGKTCLLEALRVYADDGSPLLLHRLVDDRHENLSTLADRDEELVGRSLEEAVLSPLRNLFVGHKFPEAFSTEIQIGPRQTGTDGIRLRVAAYSAYRDKDGVPVTKRLSVEALAEVPDDASLYLERQRGGDTNEAAGRPIPLHPGPYRRRRLSESDSRARFVPASGWDEDVLAAQWANVSIRPLLRDHVIAALQLVDPGIQELVMVPNPRGGGEPQPIVIYDEETRLPLKSLGDGAGRLFQMMLATVVTRGGFVLFDEFENGLHWSVQPEAWRLVFKLAEEMDLQVFATTHSWDCVRAFQEVDQASTAEGMLFHLGRSVRASKRGKVIATSYSGEELSRATRSGLEVR